jgi:hypothetical protein
MHEAVTSPTETRAVSALPFLGTTENRGGFTCAPPRHRVEGAAAGTTPYERGHQVEAKGRRCRIRARMRTAVGCPPRGQAAPSWGAVRVGPPLRAAGGSIYNKMYTQPNGGGKQTIRSDFLVSYLHVSSLFYFTYTPYSIIVPIYVGAGYAAC